MGTSPSERQTLILNWLQDTPFLPVETLGARLGVSSMTIHRDLHALTRAGQVTKVHGGVRRAESSRPPEKEVALCAHCEMHTPVRTRITLHLINGEVRYACCTHCAVFILDERTEVRSALAHDFLYDRVVSLFDLVFVVYSEVTLCCMPGILPFVSQADAVRFQRGFGGEQMTFNELRQALLKTSGAVYSESSH